jgi:hypothetical protein
MFKRVKILFEDSKKGDLGLKEEFFWEKGAIDLSKVTCFYVFVHEGESYPYTEVYFASGNSLVIDVTFETFSKHVGIGDL